MTIVDLVVRPFAMVDWVVADAGLAASVATWLSRLLADAVLVHFSGLQNDQRTGGEQVASTFALPTHGATFELAHRLDFLTKEMATDAILVLHSPAFVSCSFHEDLHG